MTAETADTQKIPFLEWLWLAHATPDSTFYPLAHLILSNSVDPSPWKNKPSLNPLFVLKDIQALYATRRPGITAAHVDLAASAVDAYMHDTTTISTLVEARKRESLRAAQAQPFIDADIPLTTTTSALQPKCIHTDTNTGRNCPRKAEPGDTRCRRHGGNPMSPEELRLAFSAAKDKLIAATESAVDITIELMETSPSDEIRRKAAEMILDRTGLVPGQVLTITTGDTEQALSPSQIIQERLQRLAENLKPKEVTQAPAPDTILYTNPHDDHEVVEGIIVEEDDDQPRT